MTKGRVGQSSNPCTQLIAVLHFEAMIIEFAIGSGQKIIHNAEMVDGAKRGC